MFAYNNIQILFKHAIFILSFLYLISILHTVCELSWTYPSGAFYILCEITDRDLTALWVSFRQKSMVITLTPGMTSRKVCFMLLDYLARFEIYFRNVEVIGKNKPIGEVYIFYPKHQHGTRVGVKIVPIMIAPDFLPPPPPTDCLFYRTWSLSGD